MRKIKICLLCVVSIVWQACDVLRGIKTEVALSSGVSPGELQEALGGLSGYSMATVHRWDGSYFIESASDEGVSVLLIYPGQNPGRLVVSSQSLDPVPSPSVVQRCVTFHRELHSALLAQLSSMFMPEVLPIDWGGWPELEADWVRVAPYPETLAPGKARTRRKR